MNDPEPAVEPRKGKRRPFGDRIPLVRIENRTGVGFKTKVFIDGVDVSNCVVNAVVTASLKDAVRATLEVLVSELEIEGAETTHSFAVRPGARDLLVRNGWTPPADEVQP